MEAPKKEEEPAEYGFEAEKKPEPLKKEGLRITMICTRRYVRDDGPATKAELEKQIINPLKTVFGIDRIEVDDQPDIFAPDLSVKDADSVFPNDFRHLVLKLSWIYGIEEEKEI